MTGFEPATPRTPCVCATRLRHIPLVEKTRWLIYGDAAIKAAFLPIFMEHIDIVDRTQLVPSYLVGVAGFEPATSCSQSRRDDRATLHPVKRTANIEYKLSLTNIFFYHFILYFDNNF